MPKYINPRHGILRQSSFKTRIRINYAFFTVLTHAQTLRVIPMFIDPGFTVSASHGIRIALPVYKNNLGPSCLHDGFEFLINQIDQVIHYLSNASN